jgi:hypothetical protein
MPLSVKLLGGASLRCHVPTTPNVVVAPGAMDALERRLPAVTVAPPWWTATTTTPRRSGRTGGQRAEGPQRGAHPAASVPGTTGRPSPRRPRGAAGPRRTPAEPDRGELRTRARAQDPHQWNATVVSGALDNRCVPVERSSGTPRWSPGPWTTAVYQWNATVVCEARDNRCVPVERSSGTPWWSARPGVTALYQWNATVVCEARDNRCVPVERSSGTRAAVGSAHSQQRSAVSPWWCPAGEAGTSSVGLRSKNPAGLRVNPHTSTGITGQSSGRGKCAEPNVCQRTMS